MFFRREPNEDGVPRPPLGENRWMKIGIVSLAVLALVFLCIALSRHPTFTPYTPQTGAPAGP